MRAIKHHVIAGVLALGIGHSAQAADPRIYVPSDLVPGTPTYWNWGGFYIGGQWGYSSANLDPGDATGPLVADILRGTTIENEARISDLPHLPKASASGSTYGGFIGFNQQWEDVILSFELNYNAGTLSASSTDSIARGFTASDGYRYGVELNSQATMTLKDYGTVRARAGYIMGRFLPYAQIGAAIGRADVSRSVTVDLAAVDADPGNPPDLPPILFSEAASESTKDAFLFGISAGAGLDVAITSSIFLRGEYEYVHFAQIEGMTLDLHTGRIGAGVKF